jgi:pimeloyl-ACP methyl ester carboxylesterase
MLAWIILVSVLALVLGAVLVATYYAYRVTFYAAPRKGNEDEYLIPTDEQYRKDTDRLRQSIQRLDALEYEPVMNRSFVGRTLFARYYHVKDGAPLQIQFHGYRGSALRDMCGGTPLAMKLGHNVLLVDQRAHGRSDGDTITFGVLERRDCLEWIRYAQKRFGTEIPIVLTGVSMGAATVLMASDLELPPAVKAVVADCPYSAPAEIIARVAQNMGLPGKPAAAVCALGGLIFGRFRLGSSSAVEAVRNSKLPILLIHGEDDRFVPCEMSRQIYDACGAVKRLETFPNAAHAMCYMADPVRYETVITDFLRAHV